MEDTASVGMEEKVDYLRRPGSHPRRPAEVEAIETHMAWVFLAGGDAWKMKKPVRYDYLDFSTLDARWRDCQREVRLNRRLAPGVYLGVRPLRWSPDEGFCFEGGVHGGADGGAGGGEGGEGGDDGAGGEDRGRAGGDGEIVEWLVHMRRLPRERMLDARIEAGEATVEDMRTVARRLADFYETVPPVPRTPAEFRGGFREEIRECRRELRESGVDLPTARLSGVGEGLLAFLSEKPGLFDARVEDDRIVEGHGDLRPEHVCLGREPVIIDCLEFNFDFRVVDPVDDLAFLALECVRLEAPELGEAVLSGYRRHSGDDPPDELVDFYRSFRALLRAKISIWHILDENVEDEHEKWVGRVREYLELADRFLPGS